MERKATVPNILVMGPPLVLKDIQSKYSQSYNFLPFFSSPLPLLHFLASLNVHESSIRAILCSPRQKICAHILGSLPSLGIIVTASIGTDHIDLPECRRRGVLVASAGGALSEDAADLAVGLFLDVLIAISASHPCVGGKRVGIVGLGNIGAQVAKRLQPFGCKVMYTSRTQKTSVAYPHYGTTLELAANSDVLIHCCALAEETHHIVNKEVMEALGKEGVIINVGRGGLVDEKELVRRLVNGEIGGAGLDVFENEPFVPNELFSLDNVVLSPHAAAITFESFNNITEIVGSNLRAFFEDTPLPTLVM